MESEIYFHMVWGRGSVCVCVCILERERRERRYGKMLAIVGSWRKVPKYSLCYSAVLFLWGRKRFS